MPTTDQQTHRLPRSTTYVLLAITFVALAVGIRWQQRLAGQRAVVSVIRQHGGSVVFSPGKPDWLRENLPGDYCLLLDSLREVHLANSTIDDTALAELSGLSEVHMLSLNSTMITDEGLAHIRDWKELEVLWLSGTAVSDRGIVHLHDLPNLKLLYLDDTNVTAAGVEKLRNESSFTDIQW